MGDDWEKTEGWFGASGRRQLVWLFEIWGLSGFDPERVDHLHNIELAEGCGVPGQARVNDDS